MRYPLGAPIRLSTEVRDLSGNLANAGNLSLVVLKPDQTQQTYSSPANPSTGIYRQDVPAADLAQVGNYQFKWVSTGANAGVSSGSFDVFDPFAAELISVDDAKDYLRKSGSVTSDDDQLERLVAAVTDVVEGIVGPVGRRTVTETVYPSSGVLLLSTTPVLSLTSVTPYAGVGLTVGNLTFNATSGVVYPGTYGGFYAGSYTAVYVAGRASVPAAVSEAALIILNHLWSPQVGGTGGVQVGGAALSGEEPFTGGFGFAVPNRAKELLAPYRLPAAVA